MALDQLARLLLLDQAFLDVFENGHFVFLRLLLVVGVHDGGGVVAVVHHAGTGAQLHSEIHSVNTQHAAGDGVILRVSSSQQEYGRDNAGGNLDVLRLVAELRSRNGAQQIVIQTNGNTAAFKHTDHLRRHFGADVERLLRFACDHVEELLAGKIADLFAHILSTLPDFEAEVENGHVHEGRVLASIQLQRGLPRAQSHQDHHLSKASGRSPVVARRHASAGGPL